MIILGSIIAVIIGAVLIVHMKKEAKQNRLITHELYFPSLPCSFDGVMIFFISDLHRRKLEDELLEQLPASIDYVIIGGDLLEKNVPLEQVRENVQKLRRLGPTFFVWGNNDYEGDIQGLRTLFREEQVEELVNRFTVIAQNEDTLVFIGVDDLGHGRDRLSDALENAPDGFRILISHNPEIVHQLDPRHSLDLVLSGHTHGGQIRLFGLGLEKPGALTKHRTFVQLVSNGYGTTGVPFRLGAPPETHVLILRRGKE
ncbi:metallophosphoesterase [Halalkalibacterium halodurans]|uniref:metallophosphoesterase n=1 Tax=Halalkalibacterium halodurans TaxID=86665 RepID=UPI002E1AE398|nr:metallophosphoesterase [Halalkalibacterium halodurans]